MSNIGKEIRMERLMDRNTGRMVVVPMDHGVTVGPIFGLVDIAQAVNTIAEGGANAVIGHIGLPRWGHRKGGKDIGLILHLSASTMVSPRPNKKVLVNTVENALRMGADGVSVHVNLGDDDEPAMLQALGEVAVECNYWGMPLLAMMYPRGRNIENETDPEMVRLAARVGAELGADFVKVSYTGDPESFARVVEGCPAPILIAGGSKLSAEEMFVTIENAMKAGAKGLSVGRNVFQSKDPVAFLQYACSIVHDGMTAQEAAEKYREKVG